MPIASRNPSRDMGAKPGIAIVPSTPVSLLSEMLAFVDLVLVMTVDPGFGGQSLIPACLQKCAAIAALRADARTLSFLISVDGGIKLNSLPAAARAGARTSWSWAPPFSRAADPAADAARTRAAYKAARH